jgi:hypothetical protein
MSLESQIKEVMQTAQEGARERWSELAQESRQWVAEQVDQLNEQLLQLQAQSRQLRKDLRRVARQRRRARQRRKLMTQLSESSKDFGKDLLKRGGEITQNLLDFGGKTTQDLTDRSGEFTQELTKRSGKVRDELAKRTQLLLEPVRRRDRTFWTAVGFSVGLVAAGAVTYQLVRRMTHQETEQNESIELPQNDSSNGSWGKPKGEIRHIDQGAASVATLEIVNVETVEKTADATIVGVKSTRLYYPVGTDIAQEDLVYFVTEEEARTQGFRAAE